jgi:hypothetical protein
MRLGLLNVASIACLVLCVALIAMSIRSYFALDGYLFATGHPFSLSISSVRGKISLQQMHIRPEAYREHSFYYTKPMSNETDDLYGYVKLHGGAARLGFSWFSLANGIYLSVPYWFPVFVCGCFMVLLRMRWPWRFNIRHLIVATTFLAVVMGMIAWLDRTWIGR